MTLRVIDPVLELDALRLALEQGEKMVLQGGSIDLGGLDEQVEQLCAHVVKTEGPLRLELLPRLEQVIHVLDRLEAGLRKTNPVEGTQAYNRIRAQGAYAGGTKPASVMDKH